MYSKNEEKQIRLDFWTGFDKYCDHHDELQWRDPKWVLYKTRIKHVELKFDLTDNSLIVALEVNHRNEDRQLDVFDAIEKYKIILETDLKNVQWDFAYELPTGKSVGRVFVQLDGVNYRREKDRNTMYEFMASNMLILENNFMDIRDSLKADLLNIE